jgi:uncharacterized protein
MRNAPSVSLRRQGSSPTNKVAKRRFFAQVWVPAFAGALFAATPAFAAAPPTDCPMRDLGFSATSPLYDVLLSPAATAAVDGVMPGFSKSLPPFFASKTIPSFATILSMKSALGLGGKADPETVAKLDAALKAVAVTDADRVARCARYDNDVPKFGKAPKGKIRVLLFEKMTGFRDGPSVEAAKAMVKDMAARKGWHLEITDKGGAINAKTLKQFDVILWNNISGDVLTNTQRKAFTNWMTKGGGFVGMHGTGGDPVYFWDWYADDLLGARFTGHPSDPQFQDAKVSMERPISGIGASIPDTFVMNEEWYSFQKSARLNGANVIATLDESTYKQAGRFGTNITMGADHPIVWTRCVGNGRSFYSAIGHRPEVYAISHTQKLIEDAVPWAAGKGKSVCKAGKEVAASQR